MTYEERKAYIREKFLGFTKSRGNSGESEVMWEYFYKGYEIGFPDGVDEMAKRVDWSKQ